MDQKVEYVIQKTVGDTVEYWSFDTDFYPYWTSVFLHATRFLTVEKAKGMLGTYPDMLESSEKAEIVEVTCTLKIL